MTGYVYNSYLTGCANGSAPDLSGADIYVALLDNTHVVDVDAHAFFDDVSGDEVSGTGYTAGGQALADTTVTQDDANNQAVFDATDVTWTTATITARFAVIYQNTGTPSTSPLVCIWDFDLDKIAAGIDFSFMMNSSGILVFAQGT